jgi:hypothetical protein
MARKPSGKLKARKTRADHRRTAVVVLGMHRSGTSALTRVLNLLGCDLPKTLLPPSPNDNDLGFWESRPLVELDNSILESAGARWDDWSPFNQAWFSSPKASEFRDGALALLREEFGTSVLFVLKEPRICRFAPFWFDALETSGVNARIILPVRNPLEVAASLSKRNGYEATYWQLLWLRHVLDAEYASRGRPRYFASYDRLMKNWSRVAVEASGALGITWPRLSSQSGSEITAFLSEKYRHYRETPENVIDNPMMSDWLRDTYRVLNDWANHGEKAGDFAVLDHVRTEFDAATPAFARLVDVGRAASRKVVELQKIAADVQTRLEVAEKAAEGEMQKAQSLVADLDVTKKQLAARMDEVKRLAALRDAKAAELDQAESARTAAEKALEESREILLAREQDIQRLNEEIGNANLSLAESGAQIAKFSSEQSAMSQVVAAAEHSLAEARAGFASMEEALINRDEELERRRVLIVTASGEAQKWRERAEMGEQELAEAQARLSHLESALAQRRAEADEAVASLASASDRLEQIEADRLEKIEWAMLLEAELAMEREHFAEQLAEAWEEIERLEALAEEEAQRVETAEAELLTEFASLEARLAEVEGARVALESDNARAQKLNSGLTAHIGLLLETTKKYQEELEAKDAALAEQGKKADELHARLTALSHQTQVDAAEQERANRAREAEIARLKQTMQQTLAEMEKLATLLKQRETEAAEREKAGKARDAEIARLKQAEEKASAERGKLAALLKQKEVDASEREKTVNARDAELSRLRQAEEKARAEREKLAVLLKQREADAAERDKAGKAREAEIARLKQAEQKTLADIGQVQKEKRALEVRFKGQSDEVAALSRRILDSEAQARAKEESARAEKERADWMRQTAAILLNGRRSIRGKLWNLAPFAVRRERLKELLRQKGLFDAAAYLRAYPDVARTGMEPLQHYVQFGMAEGRVPVPDGAGEKEKGKA